MTRALISCFDRSGGRGPRRVALFLALITFAGAASYPAHAEALRYRFHSGMYLQYRVVTEERAGDGRAAGDTPPARVETLEFWAIDQSPQDFGLFTLCTAEGTAEPSGGAFLRVDDRGERRLSDAMLARFESFELALSVLPGLDPAIGAPHGWDAPADPFGRGWHQRRGDNAGDETTVEFTLRDTSGVSALFGVEERGRYVFDRAAGLLTRLHLERREQRRGRTMTRDVTLVRKTQMPAEWCVRRARECERFERALRFEDAAIDEVENRPERAEAAIARLPDIWKSFLEEPPRDAESPVRRLAGARRERALAIGAALRERARLARQWVGSAAAHWSLQDENGATVTSESVRVGPTIECFWSADSLAGVRAFAALRRLSSEFPGRNLQVICLNLDSEVATAKRAAAAAGGGLRHVFSGPPIGGDAPTELPLIRILDERSRIVRVHFGWRPSYADSIRTATGWR